MRNKEVISMLIEGTEKEAYKIAGALSGGEPLSPCAFNVICNSVDILKKADKGFLTALKNVL